MFQGSLLVAGLVLSTSAGSFAPDALWQAWAARRFVPTAAPCLRAAELADRLRALESRHRGRVRLEEVGRSVEGRPVHLLSLGRGERRILLWSQMHGDEPSATPALLDVADTLLGGDAESEAILDRLTLLLVPMLNPDGAERYVRRNAQGIDVNRDALQGATPEGILLKTLRDRFQPMLGFNLHDQDRRTTVGDTGVLSTISLLAVAGDAQGTLTPGRARARRVCSFLARTLSAFAPGGIARYDEDWNPRAFGDNLTAWGTPIVLIESGGLPASRPLSDLTRLNYVAVLSVLRALATDDLASEDPAGYESLKRNSQRLYVDVLLEGGQFAQPTAVEPYRADLAFDVLEDDRTRAGCGGAGGSVHARIREVGDARLLAAGRRVDASGRLIVPALAASVVGLTARQWLDGSALDAMARLGLGRLTWQVASAELAEATAVAVRLSGPGRPSIEVTASAPARASLRVDRPPAAPKGTSLAEALDALAGEGWRTAAGGTLAQLLGGMAGAVRDGAPALPLLSPDGPASVLVLRPRSGGVRDLGQLDLEMVFIDGREPTARGGAGEAPVSRAKE